MGRNGEGWVILQIVALGLVAFLPPTGPRPTEWVGLVLAIVGAALAVFATVILLWGFWTLGANLRAPPDPKRGNHLVTSGPYAWVRHPIYFALIVLSLAWQVAQANLLGPLWVGLLVVVLHFKSRREERLLAEIHPDYAAYRLRVPRFLPRLRPPHGSRR